MDFQMMIEVKMNVCIVFVDVCRSIIKSLLWYCLFTDFFYELKIVIILSLFRYYMNRRSVAR
jgi:hypothetical protein